jgi:branched-subunit amino acid aminotransferase/4-amino-4-deoxychorismate lyase
VIHRYVFHNDELKPVEKVRLSPGQAGLICGWGIFTTMRIWKKTPGLLIFPCPTRQPRCACTCTK